MFPFEPIEVGTEIQTEFLRGKVIGILEDCRSRGWTDDVYYRVRVTVPEGVRNQLVSEREVVR